MFETGTHCRWMDRLFRKMGFKTIVWDLTGGSRPVATEIEAWQNLWGSAYKAVGKTLFTTKSGKKTLAYRTWASIAAEGLGKEDVLSVKVTTSGAVTATYKFFKGTFDKKGKPQYATYTCATTLIPLTPAGVGADAFAGSAFVVFPPSPSAGFPGFSAEVDYPFVGGQERANFSNQVIAKGA